MRSGNIHWCPGLWFGGLDQAEDVVAGQGVEEFDDGTHLVFGEVEWRHLFIEHRVSHATLVVKTNHVEQCSDRAVVHVRAGEFDVAKRWCLECAKILHFSGDKEAAEVREPRIVSKCRRI